MRDSYQPMCSSPFIATFFMFLKDQFWNMRWHLNSQLTLKLVCTVYLYGWTRCKRIWKAKNWENRPIIWFLFAWDALSNCGYCLTCSCENFLLRKSISTPQSWCRLLGCYRLLHVLFCFSFRLILQSHVISCSISFVTRLGSFPLTLYILIFMHFSNVSS